MLLKSPEIKKVRVVYQASTFAFLLTSLELLTQKQQSGGICAAVCASLSKNNIVLRVHVLSIQGSETRRPFIPIVFFESKVE